MTFSAPTDNEAIRDISHNTSSLNLSLQKLNETIIQLNNRNQSLQKVVLFLSCVGTVLIIVQIVLAIV